MTKANLQGAQSLVNAMIENTGVLVVLLDPEGRIVQFNRACELVSGYSFEEVRGKSPWETLIPPEEADRVRDEAFVPLLTGSSGAVGHYRNNWQSRDGTLHLIEWTNTLFPDEQGGMQFVVSVGVDVTDRTRAEESLEVSRQQLVDAQRIARIGSWTLDLRTNRLQWSDEIFRLFEIDKEKFGASYEAFLDTIHPEDRELVNNAYRASLESRQPYEIDHRLKFPDGRIRYVREACETLYDKDGNPVLSQGTVQDITEQKLAQQQVNLYASVFLNSPEAILITDQDNCIIAVNPALTELTGYSFEELEGVNPNILSSGITPPETYQEMWDSLQQTGIWQGELIDRAKDGKVFPKWTTIAAIKDDNGQVTNYIAIFFDITERKAAEERIHYLAHHDTLTGLYNRFSLEDRLGQSIAQAHREQNKLALLFIDLDRFKLINDTQGHQVGDAVLIEVGKRLQAIVRESDIIARLGGDEFFVVLTNIADSFAAASVADKIIERLGESYQINGIELRTSPSIGVSVFPNDGHDVDSLMKSSDAAMYYAKEQGRNNYQFFTAVMNEDAQERVALEHDLRSALVQEQFELYYQPKCETADGRISGVEALIRWNHPERGLVSPMKFIPIAEEVDIISELGEWVLNEACRQLSDWHAMGKTDLTMAVNLSPKQLRSPILVERISTIMAEHAITEGMLEFEVTETAAMTNADYAIEQLEAIRAVGVTLAIDDFGTGYSSLAYLRSLPIQTLKVDRSFVSGIEEDSNDAAICAATIALAHNLGLRVVAEGVETEMQRAFLLEHQCDTLQGYLLSPPLPAAKVEKLFG